MESATRDSGSSPRTRNATRRQRERGTLTSPHHPMYLCPVGIPDETGAEERMLNDGQRSENDSRTVSDRSRVDAFAGPREGRCVRARASGWARLTGCDAAREGSVGRFEFRRRRSRVSLSRPRLALLRFSTRPVPSRAHRLGRHDRSTHRARRPAARSVIGPRLRSLRIIRS